MDSLDVLILDRLKTISDPNDSDMNQIFDMYKKYLDKNITNYTKNCSCKNNIIDLYKKLMEWYNGKI